jgi:hypothetical protein
MTPSHAFTALGQYQNQILLPGNKKPEESEATSKEKGIDGCKCCILLFLKDVMRE